MKRCILTKKLDIAVFVNSHVLNGVIWICITVEPKLLSPGIRIPAGYGIREHRLLGHQSTFNVQRFNGGINGKICTKGMAREQLGSQLPHESESK